MPEDGKQHRTAPGKESLGWEDLEARKFLSRSWSFLANGRRVRSNLKDKPQLESSRRKWTRWKVKDGPGQPGSPYEGPVAPGTEPPSGYRILNPTRCWIGLKQIPPRLVKCSVPLPQGLEVGGLLDSIYDFDHCGSSGCWNGIWKCSSRINQSRCPGS